MKEARQEVLKRLSGFVAPQVPGEAFGPGFSFRGPKGVWGIGPVPASDRHTVFFREFCSGRGPLSIDLGLPKRPKDPPK